MDTVWTPYANLYFLAIWKCYTKRPEASGRALHRSATELAQEMAVYAHSDDQVGEDMQVAENSGQPLWPSPRDGQPELCRSIYMTKRLKNLLVRGRRRGRTILDRLILAYTAAGFGPEETVEQAYADYTTAPDVPALSRHDVSVYAGLFWNFAGLFDIENGIEWVKRHFPDSDEERIVRGDLSVDSVRAKLGAPGDFDFEARMARLTQQSMHAIERCISEVNAVDRERLLFGKQQSGQQGGRYSYSNANLRNTSAMISSLLPILKTYQEETSGGGEGGKPLGEYMDERLSETLQQAEEYTEHYGDWEEMREDNTFESLAEENEEVERLREEGEAPEEGTPEGPDVNMDIS
jgi:hypothetical protein